MRESICQGFPNSKIPGKLTPSYYWDVEVTWEVLHVKFSNSLSVHLSITLDIIYWNFAKKKNLPLFQGCLEQKKLVLETLGLGEGGLVEGNFMQTCQSSKYYVRSCRFSTKNWLQSSDLTGLNLKSKLYISALPYCLWW